MKIFPVEGTALKVYWLRGPSPTVSRASGDLERSRLSSAVKVSPLSSRGSPLRRLTSVENHLVGNALTRVLEGKSPAVQLVAIEAYQAHKQIREDVSFIETLELNHAQIEATGTGYLFPNESVGNVKNILRGVFVEGELNPYMAKVVVTTRSIDAFDKNYSVDWARVSYVISQLLQNAFKHGGDGVKLILDIEYEAPSEMLKMVIQDDGPGMDPDYLREALDGITFTEDAKAPTSKPGIILRICRLLVEDVLKGRLMAITNFCGTSFELSIKVKSMQIHQELNPSALSYPIETGYIDLQEVAGGGSASKDSSLIHSERSAFKRVASSLKLDDFISLDPPRELVSDRHRRKGYFQLPGLQSSLVPLETILALQTLEEDVFVVTDLETLLVDIDIQIEKLPLNAPILHVDYENSGRMMLSRFMRQSKLVSTEVADSGRAALEKVQKAIACGKPFQMIFMDQMLGGDIPELDKGNKVAERILEIYRNSGLCLPIIIPASGNMAEEDLAIYRDSGMSCEIYLQKPFRVEQMTKIVQRYFTAS